MENKIGVMSASIERTGCPSSSNREFRACNRRGTKPAIAGRLREERHALRLSQNDKAE